MIVVSSSTFRNSQSKYMDMAANGVDVVVTRNNRPSVVLAAVQKFDLSPSRDITGNLVKALNEVKDMRQNKILARPAKDFINEL